MKEQILRLCKRLDSFTLDDILLISEIDSEVLVPILNELKTQNKLRLNNGYYKFIKHTSVKKTKPSIMEYYPPQIIDLMLRCYCADIPSPKTEFLLGLCEQQILKFYKYFRTEIYKCQYEEVQELYKNKPLMVHYRMFFIEYKVYFYAYNNNIYVVEKPFKSRKEQLTNKDDIQELKKVTSYINRALYQSTNIVDLPRKVAEAIWKRNKSFEERYSELKSLIL